MARHDPKEVICLDDDEEDDEVQAITPPAQHHHQPPQRQVQSTFLHNIDLSKLPPHILERLAVGYLGSGGFRQTHPSSYEEAFQTRSAKPDSEVTHGGQGRGDSGQSIGNASLTEHLSNISRHDRVEPRLPDLRRSSLYSSPSQNEAAHQLQHGDPTIPSGATNVTPSSPPRISAAFAIDGAALSPDLQVRNDEGMDISPSVAGPSRGPLGVSGFRSFSVALNTPPASRSGSPPPLTSAQNSLTSAQNSRPSSRDCAPPIRPSNTRPNSAECPTPPSPSIKQAETSVFAQPKGVTDPKPSGTNLLSSSVSSSRSQGSDASSHEADPRPSSSNISDRDSNQNATKRDSFEGERRLADAPEVNLPLSPSVLKTYKQSFADKRRLQHELAEMMGKNNSLTGEIDNLNFEYMTLKNKLILSQAEVGVKDGKVDELETLLEQKENQLTSLNDELNKTIEELHHVQGVLDGRADSEMPHGTPPINTFQVTEFLKELSEVKALNNRYQMNLVREHEKNSQLQRVIFEREKEIRRLENSQANKDTKIQSLEMQKLLMEDQVKHVRADAAKQVELPAAPNERVTELESQLKKAREELEKQTVHAKKCQLERNFMESVMAKGETTMKSLRQAVETKNSELEKTQNENVKLKKQLMELEVRDIGTNASTKAVKQLELNLANEKLAKDTANTAFQEVEKDNAKLRDELTSTKTLLAKTTNKFNKLYEAHQKNMAELVSMTSQMRASQTVLAPLKAENQKLTEDFTKTSDELLASENRCKIYYECQEEMKDTYETYIVERDALITRLKRQMAFYQEMATSHKKLMQSTLNLLHVFEDICQGLATQGGHQHQMTHQVFQKLLRMVSVTEMAPPIGPDERSETETASCGEEEMPCPVTETEAVDAVATVTTRVSTPRKRPDDRSRNHPPSPKASTLKSPMTPKSSLMGALGRGSTPSIRTAGTSLQGLRAEDTSPGKMATVCILGRNSSFKDDNVIRVPHPGAPIRSVSDQERSVGEVATASTSGVTSRSIVSLPGTSSVGETGEGMTLTERSGVRKDRTSGASSGVESSESSTQQASRGIGSGGVATTSGRDGTASPGVVTGTGTASTEEELLHESSTAPEPVTSSGQSGESGRVDVNDISDYTAVVHPHWQEIDAISEKDTAAIFPLETLEDVSLDGSNSMEEGYNSLILTLPDFPEDDPLETKYLLQKAIKEKQKEFEALGCMPGVRLNSSGEVEMFVDEGPIFIKSEDVSVPSVQIKTELCETAGSPVVGESGEPGAQVTEDSCGNVEATLKGIYDILDKSKDIHARLSRANVLEDAAVSGVSESVPIVRHIAEVVEKSAAAAESPLENSCEKEDSVAEVVKEDRVHALEPGVLNSQVADVREHQASGEKSLSATGEDEHQVTDPADLSTQILNILEKKRQSDQVPSGGSLLIRQGAVPNFVALLKESVQALNQSGKTSNLDENEGNVNTDETLRTIERPLDVALSVSDDSGPVHSRIIEVDTANHDSPISDSNVEARTKQFRQSVDLEQDRERVGRESEGMDGNHIEKLQAQVDKLLQSRKEIFELHVEMAETSTISKVDKALSSAQQSEQMPLNVNKHLSSAQEPIARENVLVAKVGDLGAKETKTIPADTGLVAKETVQVTRDRVTEDDTDDILSYKLNESNEKVDIAVHVSFVESDSDDEVQVIKTERFSPRSEKGPKNVIETVTISDSGSDTQELDEISDAKSIEAEFPPLKPLDLAHFREVASEEDFVAYEIKNMSSPVPDDSERDLSGPHSPEDIPDIFDSQNSDYVGEFDESAAEFGLRTPSPELEEEGEEIEDQEEEEQEAGERPGGREEEFLFERGGEEDHYVPEEESVKLPRTSARSVGKYPRTAGQRLYQGLAMRGSKYVQAQKQKKASSAQHLERNLVEEQEFCHSLLCRYFMSKKYQNLRATKGRKRGRGGKPVAMASSSRQGSREQLGQIIGEGANAGNGKQGQDGTLTRPSYSVDLPNSVSGDQSLGQNHPTELPHAFGINERWSHLHPVNAPGPSHGSGGGDHDTPPSSPAKPAWTHLGGTPWAPEGSTPVTSGQQRKGQPSKKKSIWAQNRESIRAQFTKGGLKPKKSLKSGTLLNFNASRPYTHPLLKNQCAAGILCDVNIDDAALAQVFNSARQASSNVNIHLSSAQQTKQAPSNVDKHQSSIQQREQAPSNVNIHLSSAQQTKQAPSNANKHLPSAERSEQTTAGPTALNVNTNFTHAALPYPVDTSMPGLDDVLASVTSQRHSSSGVSEPPGEQTFSQADSGKTVESATAIPNKEQDQIGFGHKDLEAGVSPQGDSLDKEQRASQEGSISSIASDELEFLNRVDTSNTSLMAPQNSEQATAPDVSRATKPSDAGVKSQATISDAGRKLQAKVTKASCSSTFQSTSRCDAAVSQSGGEETLKQKDVAGEKVKTGYGKLMLEHQKVCKNVIADCKKSSTDQGVAAEMGIKKNSTDQGMEAEMGIKKSSTDQGMAAEMGIKKSSTVQGVAAEMGIRKSSTDQGMAAEMGIKKSSTDQGVAAEMGINKAEAERETVKTSLENVRKSQEASIGLEQDGIDARNVRERVTSAQDKDGVQAKTLREMTRVKSEATRPKTVPEKTRLESEKGSVTAKTIQEKGPFRQEEDRVDSNAEREKAGSEGGKGGEGVREQASAEQEKDRVTLTAEHEKAKATETERKLEKRRVEQLETIKRYRVDAAERRCGYVRKKHHQADKDYECSKADFASIQMRRKNARSYGERSRLEHLASNAVRRERLAAETLQYLKLDLDRAVAEHQKAKDELDQFLKRSSENVAREKKKEQSTSEQKNFVEKSATTQEHIVDKPGDQSEVRQHVIKVSPNKIVLKKAEPSRSQSKGQTGKGKDLSAFVNPRVAAEVLDGKTVAMVGTNKYVLKSPTKKVGLDVGKDAPVQKAAGVVEEKSRAETDDVTFSDHMKLRTEMNVGSGRDHRNKPWAVVTEVKAAAATLGAGSDPINPATKMATASLRTDSSPSVPQTKEVAASKTTSDSATAGTVAASSFAILTNQGLQSVRPSIYTPSLGKREGMIDRPWLGKTVSASATSDAIAEGDHAVGGKRDDKDADQGQREMEKTRKDSTEDGKSDEDRKANIGLTPKLADNVLDEYLDGLEDVSDAEAKDAEKQSEKFETLDSFLDNLEDVGLEKEGVAGNDDDDEEEEDGDEEEVEGSVADDRTSDEDSDGMGNIGGEEAEKESGAEEEEEDDRDDRDDDAEGDTKKTGDEQSVDKLCHDITDDQSIDANFEEKSADDLKGTGGEWNATCDDVSDDEDLELVEAVADDGDSALRADSDGLEDISDAELEFSQQSGSGTPMRVNSPRVKDTGDYSVLDEVSRKREIVEECAQLGKKLEKAKERKVEQTKRGEKSNSKTKDDEIVKNTASVKECLNFSALSRSRSYDEADVSFMTSDISEDESDLEFNLEASPGYPPTPPRFPPGFDLRLVLNTRHKVDGHVSQEETVESEALSGSNTSCEGSCFSFGDKCPDLKITCNLDEEELNLTISDSDSDPTEELEADDKIQSRRLQNLKEPSVKRSTQDVNRSTHDGKRSTHDKKRSVHDQKRSAHDGKRSGNTMKRKAKDLTREEKAEKLRRSLAEIDARLEETRKKRKISKADEESQHTKIKPSRRESFENKPGIFHRLKRPCSPFSRSRCLSLSRQSPARSLATHSVNKAKTYQTRAPKVSGSYNFDCKTGRWYWDSDSGFLTKQLDSGEQQTSESEVEDRIDVVAIEGNLENPRCMEVESPDDSPESPESVTETPQSPDSNLQTDPTSLATKIPLNRDNTPDIENIGIKLSTGNDMPKMSPDADTPKSPDAEKCPIGVGPPVYGSVDPKPIPSSPIRARLSSPGRARQNSSIKANTMAGEEPKFPIGHGTRGAATADAMSIKTGDNQEPQTKVSNGKTKTIGSPKPKKNTMKNRPRSPVGVGSVAGTGENVQKGGEPLNKAVESETSDAIGRSPSQKKKRLRDKKRKGSGIGSPAQGELGSAAEPGCAEATKIMMKQINTSPISSIDLIESDLPGEGAANHEQKKKKKCCKRKNLGPNSPPKTFTVAKAVLALRDGTFTKSVSDSKCAKLSFTETKPAEKSASLDKSNADTAETNIAASVKHDASALKPSPSRIQGTELESKSVGESSKGDSEICQKNTSEAKEMKQTGSVGEILRPNRSRRERSREVRSAEISRSGRRDISPRYLSGTPSPRSDRKGQRSDPRSIERDSRSGTKSKSPSSESDANRRHPALSRRSRPSQYDYSRGDRSRVDLRSPYLKNRDCERRDWLDHQFQRDRSRSRVYQSSFYRYDRSKSPNTIRRERNRERTPILRKRKISDSDLKPPNSGKSLKTGEERSSSERSGQSLRNRDKVAGPTERENADRATSAAKGITKPCPQDDVDKVSSPRKRDAAGHAEGLRPKPPLREHGEKVSKPGKRGNAGCAAAAGEGSKRLTLPDDKLLSGTDSDRASAEKSEGADQNVSGLAAYVKNEKWKRSPHKTPASRRIAEAYQDQSKETSEVYVVPMCHGLGRRSSHPLGNSKNCLKCCAKRKELGLKTVCPIPVKRVAAISGPVTPAQIFAKSVEMPVFGQKMSTGPSTAVDNTAGVLNSGVETKELEQVSSVSAETSPSAAGGIVNKLVRTYGESEKTGEKMNNILTNILKGMQKTGGTRNSARAGQNLSEDVQNSAEGAEGDGQGVSNNPRETRSNTKNLSSFWKL